MGAVLALALCSDYKGIEFQRKSKRMTPTVFTAIVAAAGVLASIEGLLYWLLAFCLLGSTESVGLPAVGGSSVLPGPFFIPFLLVRTWRECRYRFDLHHVPRSVFWQLSRAGRCWR